MKAFEIIFGWNRGDTPPDRDGWYYIARIHGDRIHIETQNYTTALGWNTLLTKTGDHEIKYENYFWTQVVRIKE